MDQSVSIQSSRYVFAFAKSIITNIVTHGHPTIDTIPEAKKDGYIIRKVLEGRYSKEGTRLMKMFIHVYVGGGPFSIFF